MIDEMDRKILGHLQRNAMATAQELGDSVGLSPSQAARRRARLEERGIIEGYIACIAPAKVGLGVQAFVQVQLGNHDPAGGQSFRRLLETLPEVVNAWTLTGEADYLLRLWCADLAELNTLIHARILPHKAVARVQSQIVMDQLKATAPLPV